MFKNTYVSYVFSKRFTYCSTPATFSEFFFKCCLQFIYKIKRFTSVFLHTGNWCNLGSRLYSINLATLPNKTLLKENHFATFASGVLYPDRSPEAEVRDFFVDALFFHYLWAMRVISPICLGLKCFMFHGFGFQCCIFLNDFSEWQHIAINYRDIIIKWLTNCWCYFVDIKDEYWVATRLSILLMEEILHQLIGPVIYKVLYMPGG